MLMEVVKDKILISKITFKRDMNQFWRPNSLSERWVAVG